MEPLDDGKVPDYLFPPNNYFRLLIHGWQQTSVIVRSHKHQSALWMLMYFSQNQISDL